MFWQFTAIDLASGYRLGSPIMLMLAMALLITGQVSAGSGQEIWSKPYEMAQRPRPTFPEQARANGGRVDLVCAVVAGGRVNNCEVLSEQPVGQGFGRAAIASMRQARIVEDSNGPQPGARIKATISFWNGQGQLPSYP